MSSNRVIPPMSTLRRMSGVHHSPTTSSERAMGHSLCSKLLRRMPSRYVVSRWLTTAARVHPIAPQARERPARGPCRPARIGRSRASLRARRLRRLHHQPVCVANRGPEDERPSSDTWRGPRPCVVFGDNNSARVVGGSGDVGVAGSVAVVERFDVGAFVPGVAGVCAEPVRDSVWASRRKRTPRRRAGGPGPRCRRVR